MHNWKIQRYKEAGFDEEQAINGLIVVMLDCWPVNLTAITRDFVKDHCPGMELMFVPAGGTGRFQINDTDLHAPYKNEIRLSAFAWYAATLQDLRKRLRDESITQSEFDFILKQSMTMPVLRDHAPEWAQSGVNKLLQPSENAGSRPPELQGYNIIKYGWHRIYLQHVKNPAFQTIAVEKCKARKAHRNAANSLIQLSARSQSMSGDATTASNEPSLESLLAVVAEYERALHEEEVPKEPAREEKAVSRNSQGSSRQRSFGKYAQNIATAESRSREETDKQLELHRNPRTSKRKKNEEATCTSNNKRAKRNSAPCVTKCGLCKKRGHRKPQCPNKANVLWLSDDDSDKDEDQDVEITTNGLVSGTDFYSDNRRNDDDMDDDSNDEDDDDDDMLCIAARNLVHFSNSN